MSHPVINRVTRDCDDAQRVWDGPGMKAGPGPKVRLYVHDVRLLLELARRYAQQRELLESAERLAHASLLAAAPDLLEAAERVLYELAELEDVVGEPQPMAAHALRAAVDKAKGDD